MKSSAGSWPYFMLFSLWGPAGLLVLMGEELASERHSAPIIVQVMQCAARAKGRGGFDADDVWAVAKIRAIRCAVWWCWCTSACFDQSMKNTSGPYYTVVVCAS